MRIWWELKDVHPKAMQEFQRLLESDEDEDDELWEKKPSTKSSTDSADNTGQQDSADTKARNDL